MCLKRVGWGNNTYAGLQQWLADASILRLQDYCFSCHWQIELVLSSRSHFHAQLFGVLRFQYGSFEIRSC